MTTTAFIEAQKQLVRVLAHHMIQIAERAHVINSQKTSTHILENAYHLWKEKTVFEWEIVQLDVPRELGVDSNPFPDYSSGHNAQEVGSTDVSCRQLPANPNAACWSDSLSDTVSSDDYHQRSTFGITGTTENPTLGRCVFCNDALDADGLCRPCLLLDLNFPMDGTPNDPDIPRQCQTVSDTQTSAMTDSMPCLSDDWNWLDPPNTLAENFGVVPSPSSRQGLDSGSTSYANPSWHGYASGASTLSIPWMESASKSLTSGIPEFASPMNVFNDSSSGMPITDDCYLASIDSHEHHS